MNKTVLFFIGGSILTLLTVGAVFFAQNYIAKADTSFEPKNIKVNRASPTSAQISFITDKPAIASIECSTNKTGSFSICGAENTKTANHKIRASIILDPSRKYYYKIKVGKRTYDNIGTPFLLPKYNQPGPTTVGRSFPTNLLGLCKNNTNFDSDYDINKDGCIMQNDWDLFGR